MARGSEFGYLRAIRRVKRIDCDLTMLRSLFALFFGCSHTRTTFPMTSASKAESGRPSQAHVTCLNCGEELLYDWQKMEIEGGSGLRGRGWSKWVRFRAGKLK